MNRFSIQYLKVIAVLLIPLVLGACNWPSYTKILSSFTDDPEFDRNLESNQLSKLSFLYYYWPQTTLMLQCLAPNNTWVSLAGSEVTRNPDGSLRNFNTGAPENAVFHHYWNGDLIRQMSANCRVQESTVSTLKTDLWTYTRKQKSLTLRLIQTDGFVPPYYSDAERACFGNHPAVDLWQRHAQCNDSSNDASFIQSIDEQMTRVSNYGSISATFGSNLDKWSCNWKLFIDNVPQNVNSQGVQMVYGRDGGSVPTIKVKKGVHTIKFDRNGLICYPTTRSCPTANSCVHDSIYLSVKPSVPAGGGLSSSSAKADQTGNPTKIFQIEVK